MRVTKSSDQPVRRAGLSIGCSLFFFLIVMLFIGFPASPLFAHHILGLPHYSYKDNYPQAPTLEYPAQAGPYDILMTSYPGKPLPGETANVAIYIKNRQTGIPYQQPVEIRVLETFTFGKSLEVVPRTQCTPFDQLHKLAVTFPREGEYVVELTMQVEGKPEVIPFVMVAGDPSATGSILIVIGIGLVIFLVVVRAIKIKRARRGSQTTDSDFAICTESIPKTREAREKQESYFSAT